MQLRSFQKMNTIYQKIKKKITNHDFLFVVLNGIRVYCIYFLNKFFNYKYEKIRFYYKLGYQLNLQDPQSFNEKSIWKKIYDRNPLLPITTDKYQVRSYITKVLGEEKAKEILIPLLYVTEQPETIPFERLPPAFMVKPNHASGLHIIVERGDYNQEEIIKNCRRWLKTSYGHEKLEWAYQLIKRKIIIEELLREDDGKIPKEFLFHMFHGKCKRISVVFDRMNHLSVSFFDENFSMFFNDVDLCYRIKNAGWKIYFVPDAQVLHYRGASTRKAKRKMIWLSHLSFYKFFKKHKQGLTNRLLLLFFCIPLFLSALPRMIIKR